MQVLSLAWLCTKTQTSQITHLTRIYTDQKSCKSRLFSDETFGSWLFRCWRLRVIPAIPLGFQFWQFRRFWQFWQSPVALCLCPSARTPPPISVLLKTKVKPQFDRAVDRTVEALFFRFSGLQSGSISALFSRFYCPVGRGSQRLRRSPRLKIIA